jgi:hypothetical protein
MEQPAIKSSGKLLMPVNFSVDTPESHIGDWGTHQGILLHDEAHTAPEGHGPPVNGVCLVGTRVLGVGLSEVP